MDEARPLRHAASHEILSDSYPVRARFNSERGPSHLRSSAAINTENRTVLLPSGLNSMLKTTTETGDIGLFSIKPSRLPRHTATALIDNSSQNYGANYADLLPPPPLQDYQLFNLPLVIDDRKRLPSYTRDVTSEIVSLYENTSQKSTTSSRVFDEPDRRSYSMTQTSYSGSRLANHRSYASLRSQAEQSIGQRPRSPFAYPTRLKRPGFRPCSPALTDGGVVDYSRRAEIGRVSNASGPIELSMASNGPFKRPSPLPTRSDMNRHVPSSGSQGSLPKNSMLQSKPDSVENLNDWTIRTERGTSNASPARSTYSLASTVTANPTGPSGSTATTPGRLHPPSPLYYDYTEDFDNNDEQVEEPQQIADHLPPPFLIERTIHEDRELSSDWSYIAMADSRGAETLLDQRLQTAMPDSCLNMSDHTHDVRAISKAAIAESRVSDQLTVSICVAKPIVQDQMVAAEETGRSRTEAGPSVLNKRQNGSRQEWLARKGSNNSSGSNFRRALAENCAPIEPSSVPNEDSPFNQQGSSNDDSYSDHSSYRLSAHLPAFPKPPDRLVRVYTKGTLASSDHRGMAFKLDGAGSSYDDTPLRADLAGESKVDTARAQPLGQNGFSSIQRSISVQDDRVRSSKYFSVDYEISDLARMIMRFEDANPQLDDDTSFAKAEIGGKVVASKQRETDTEHASLSRHGYQVAPKPLFDHRSKSTLAQFRSDGNLRLSRQALEAGHRMNRGDQRVGFDHYSNGRRMERSSMSDGDSSILSPTPIHPPRALRLKNDNPQLMKALPGLPPRPLSKDISQSRSIAIPSRAATPLIGKSAPTIVTTKPLEDLNLGNETKTTPRITDQIIPGDLETPSSRPFLSRFKLKPRSPAVLQNPSPPQSRPWNLEESYPWNSQQPNVDLAPILLRQHSAVFNPPRLKLKMTRTSSSILGTVRVNRDAGIKNTLDTPELLHPKDIFTSSSPLVNMFRQVSRKFHSKEASDPVGLAVRNPTEEPSSPTARVTEMGREQNGVDLVIKPVQAFIRSSSEVVDPVVIHAMPSIKQALPSAKVSAGINATEVQSFFSDDSSQVPTDRSLRKRISNFRSRIPGHHASRSLSRQSSDDIVWRQRNPKLGTGLARSDLNQTAFNTSLDVDPVRRTHKLKTKISCWFRGARTAVLTCVKSRASSETIDMSAGADLP